MLDAIDDHDEERGRRRLDHAVAAFYERWRPRAEVPLAAVAMRTAGYFGHTDQAGHTTVDVYVDDYISYFSRRLNRELRGDSDSAWEETTRKIWGENLMAKRIQRGEVKLKSLTHYGFSLIKWTCQQMRSELPSTLKRANEQLVGDLDAIERLVVPDGPGLSPRAKRSPEPGTGWRRRGRRPGRSDNPVYKRLESLDRLGWVRAQLDKVEHDLWLRADHYSLSYREIIDGAPDLGLPGVAQLYPDTAWNPNQLAQQLHRLRARVERLHHQYDDPKGRR